MTAYVFNVPIEEERTWFKSERKSSSRNGISRIVRYERVRI